MYGWFNIGNNVAGIMFNMIVVVFFVVVALADRLPHLRHQEAQEGGGDASRLSRASSPTPFHCLDRTPFDLSHEGHKGVRAFSAEVHGPEGGVRS